MSLSPAHSLVTIPQEVLEHIAYFVATSKEIGPPTDLVPLLATNRRIASLLSASANPHLYARIFDFKFDTSAARRRLRSDDISTVALSEELQKRCFLLKRVRHKLDCTTRNGVRLGEEEHLSSILWMAYFMMLENDGRNERHLREFARIDEWLWEFWFEPDGSSGVMASVREDSWPHNHENVSLGMWLFWLLLKPDDYMNDDFRFKEAAGILKLIALGAHHYPLCYPSWINYIPTHRVKTASVVRHYRAKLSVVAPAPAAPAILSYLTLANNLPGSVGSSYVRPLAPTVVSSIINRDSREWDTEWARTLSVGNPCIVLGNTMSRSFKPGSLEGFWEGLFTYTEFTAYAALLTGAAPATLQRSLVAQHRQTWRLREYHLIYEDSADLDSGRSPKDVIPLSPGNPARGYIPNGSEIHEGMTTLEIFEPGNQTPLIYHHISVLAERPTPVRIKDVFVTGEGHSAWGQFSLVGRIRPCDGFISLSKEYVDRDRGKWLYRGYLVGDANGNLSGRWRDTLTMPQVSGYEGCFIMSRRK